MDLLVKWLPDVGASATYLLLYLMIIWVAKSLLPIVVRYKIYDEIAKKNNVAASVAYCGYLAAISCIYISTLVGPSQGLVTDVMNICIYSGLGCVLLFVARFINDKVILYKFKISKEVIDDQNAGTGAVIFGSYFASGLIVAGAVHGEGGGVVTALAFFALGQIALVACAKIYNLITPFDVHEQIEKDNVAVGISSGATLIALGIVMFNGASGDFVSWQFNIGKFLTVTAIALIILPAVRFLLDKVLIPHYDMNKELEKDGNIAAALVEATMVITFAVTLSVAI